MKKLIEFFKEQNGATAAEYALMVSLIAMVIIAAVTLLGTSLNQLFQTAASSVVSAGSGS
jgi:pilus assembly protein Flp/PilA